MQKWTCKVIKIVAILVAFLITATSTFSWIENKRLAKAIPAHFKIESVVLKRTESGLGDSCGGIVFRVSETTLDIIKRQGLEFLNSDLTGRGYRNVNPKELHHYKYKQWQETPLVLGEGLSYGLYCLLKGNKEMARKVLDASKAKGSFHVWGEEMEIFIVPEMKILIYAYSSF